MQMKRVVFSLVGAVGIGLLTCVPARAHHAFAAEFDATKPVKVQGAVVKVQWTNPHVWIFVDAKAADGTVEHWMFEGNGPGALTRRGFTKDYLKPGTEIVVEGFLSKGVPHRANARTMTYPDGRMLFVGSSGTGAPKDGKDPTER
jgi:hypothetical protein